MLVRKMTLSLDESIDLRVLILKEIDHVYDLLTRNDLDKNTVDYWSKKRDNLLRIYDQCCSDMVNEDE